MSIHRNYDEYSDDQDYKENSEELGNVQDEIIIVDSEIDSLGKNNPNGGGAKSNRRKSIKKKSTKRRKSTRRRKSSRNKLSRRR